MKIIVTIITLLSINSYADSGLSFVKDVKPIFQRSCMGCHNGSNPLPVVSLYPVAYRLRNEIKTRVSDEKTMPKYGTYISASERDLVKRWVLDGAKE